MTDTADQRRRPGLRALALALGGVLAGVGLGSWATWILLAPPVDVLAAPDYVVVTAEQGTVGQALNLSTSADWPAESTVTGAAAGTVTTVDVTPGTSVAAGDVLYTVDLRPVVALQGAVPSFRDLGPGSQGGDVAQLQQFLIGRGHLSGAPDGVFSPGTADAVRAWHASLGLDARGDADPVVRRGDVIFLPTLPARLAPAAGLAVGMTVAEGHPAFDVLAPEPRFTIALTENQELMVSPGLDVELTSTSSTWRARVAEIIDASAEEPIRAVLGPVEGTSVCGESCGELTPGVATLLPSRITVVPDRTGVVVPAAAVVTGADGATGVTLADGEFTPVTVLAKAQGQSVVRGVSEGTRVRIPGQGP